MPGCKLLGEVPTFDRHLLHTCQHAQLSQALQGWSREEMLWAVGRGEASQWREQLALWPEIGESLGARQDSQVA